MKRWIDPLKVVLSGLIAYLGLYSFVSTSVYTDFVGKLNSLMIMLEAMPLSKTTVTIVFVLIVTILVFLVAFFRGKGYVEFLFTFSFLLFVPSVLPFSETNWLSIVDIVIETNLSSFTILAVGIVIIAGSTLLVEVTQISEFGSNLSDRGATEETIEKVVRKKMLYSSSLVVFSGGLSVFVLPVASFFVPELQRFLSGLPLVHILVAIGTAIAISLTVLFYLISQGSVPTGETQNR